MDWTKARSATENGVQLSRRNTGPMDAQAYSMWVCMLRSDKYRKAKGQLFKPGEGMSAVGILCKAYSQDIGGGFRSDGSFVDDKENRRRCGAPTDVLAWANLIGHSPGIRINSSDQQTVVALNDGLGEWNPQSFDYIANLIALHL